MVTKEKIQTILTYVMNHWKGELTAWGRLVPNSKCQ